jgi:phosphoribosylformylglycinamidine synthase
VGPWKAPVPLDPPAWVLEELKKPRDYTADLKKLLASANICSKHWIYEQYDSMVQTNTVQGPGGEAGVMRIKGTGSAHKPGVVEKIAEVIAASTPEGEAALETDATNPGSSRTTGNGERTTGPERGLAMALAGNGRWTYLDPRLGAMHAVAEAARKVACTGATPVAATNCLNFGNPEKPEIMAQTSAAIDGIAEACTALDTPVTGGNVSLYNETKGEGIYPTPVIGVVGILDDVTKAVPSAFQASGHDVILVASNFEARNLDTVGDFRCFGSSEYAKTISGTFWGMVPVIEVDTESDLHKALAKLASEGLIHSASDVSDGGLAVTLARATFPHSVGVQVDGAARANGALSLYFTECSSMVVVTCDPDKRATIESLVDSFGDNLYAEAIGTTGGDSINFRVAGESVISGSIEDLKVPYLSALESQLAAEVLA